MTTTEENDQVSQNNRRISQSVRKMKKTMKKIEFVEYFCDCPQNSNHYKLLRKLSQFYVECASCGKLWRID